MNVNDRIFKAVLLLSAILVAAGYGLVFFIRLDQPVFFHHYLDQRVSMDREVNYQGGGFNLKYITNLDDDRVVIDVEFPEFPDLVVHSSEFYHTDHFNWGQNQGVSPGETYGRYSLRTVYCEIVDLQDDDFESAVVTKAKILFGDFSQILVDIGEIHLYRHDYRERPFEHVSSTGSSDGSSSTNYRILEDMTLVGFESDLMKRFEDRISWKINGMMPDDAPGTELIEGSIFSVSSNIKPSEDIKSRFAIFDVQPELVFELADGSLVTQRFYNINSLYHHYSFKDIFSYLRERGEI